MTDRKGVEMFQSQEGQTTSVLWTTRMEYEAALTAWNIQLRTTGSARIIWHLSSELQNFREEIKYFVKLLKGYDTTDEND